MAITVTPEEKKVLNNVLVPPQPKAMLAVVAEARKDDPSIPIIVDAINGDMGIASAVLQVVNSAAYRRALPIESIEQAVLVLGIRRVVTLVKSVALKSSMEHSQRLEGFWNRANRVAVAAAIFADMLNRPKLIDFAHMLGLFHEAGVAIMFQNYPEYSDILRHAEELGWLGLYDMEKQQCETNHCAIGALLARKWKLPRPIIEVIYYQHDTDGLFTSGELSDVSLEMLSILKLARQTVALMQGRDSQNSEWQSALEQMLDFWQLEETDIDEMINRCIEDLYAND